MSEKDQNEKLKSDELIRENIPEGRTDTYSRKKYTGSLNIAPLSRKKSSYIDIAKAKEEANELLKDDKNQLDPQNKLMFEEKKISIFRVYGHLNRPIDYFYMFLAFIGSVGSGISMPIQAYISSDLFSEVGNTSESEITPELYQMMLDSIDGIFNKMIKRF